MAYPTPTSEFVYGTTHYALMHDVTWVGGVLTLPFESVNPRTAAYFQARLYTAGATATNAAELDAISASAASLMYVIRDANGVWSAHANGVDRAAGTYVMLTLQGGTTKQTEHVVLPTGLNWAASAPAPVPGLTDAAIAKLRKTGFSPRSAKMLGKAVSAPETVDWKTALRRGDLSYRQMNTLRNPPAGGHTMKSLLRGGFTRHQAKLILGG